MTKVLIIAEACNPEWVSVPLEGWSHAQALRSHPEVEAHIITHIRNRDALLRAGLIEGADFTAIDSEGVSAWTWKIGEKLRGGAGKGWTTMMAAASVSYYYFEHLLWKTLGERIRAGEWDIVHRVTPLSPTIPSLLARKCATANIPFVVGPLNGGLPWPRWFDSARRAEREWLSYIRNIYKVLPGYLSMRRNAAAIICGSHDTLSLEPAWVKHKLHYIPENAIDPARFGTQNRPPTSGVLRVVFVGRLVPYKGCDMLLEAAAPLIHANQVTIEIIGDGPQRKDLESIAAKEGIASGVNFTGFIPHTELQTRLVNMDVLGFPSIREFGGAVVLEAMALGVVPIVVNYGGPGELITPNTGIGIQIGPRSSIVASLREALSHLVNNRARLQSMSRACPDHVLSNFTWNVKAAQTIEVYRHVLRTRR